MSTTIAAPPAAEAAPKASEGGRRPPIAVVAYSALFAVALPLALVGWMRRLDTLVQLRPVASQAFGMALLAVGAAIAAAGVASLWRFGRGLPMSPFPPERLVSSGAYAVVADPIYVGSGFACAGVSILLGSAAGLWIVTPVFVAAMAAFVLGYERDATLRRFGRTARPALSIPPGTPEPVSVLDRVAVYALVIAPWLVLYEAVEYLGVPRAFWTTYLGAERSWLVIPWTEGIYVLAYPFVLLAPLAAARRGDLRRFALDGLAATAAIIPFYLLVPLVADAKPVPGDSMWAPLMLLERWGNAAVTAFPAFHVVWVCIAGALLAARWPALRGWMAAFAAAIGAACVTSGMHSSADVVAGFAAYGLVRTRGALWVGLCRVTERIANSWREKTVGPVRFLNHGVYAGVGAVLGVGLGAAMAGPEAFWWMVGLSVAAEIGAATWAQVVEGSSLLLRPYGYFGSVIAVVAMAPVAGAFGVDPWKLLAGMSVAACVTQPFGRLRCLVQGCCHGRAIESGPGIRYTHPRSRVLRLSSLGGVALHPTPLYSILWTLLVGAALVRLWTLAVPLPFICGSYLLLIGIGRFVEEHYRGEPQTAWVAGLRLYQWLAIAFVIAGAALMAVAGMPAPSPRPPHAVAWLALAALGLVTYAAYGVDFPRSTRRFSRLV
jgi:protein-S-isoprenylcysteine O-methyltransferase Ste14